MTPSTYVLPDAAEMPKLYSGVLFKRVLAFLVDATIITLITLIFAAMTAFVALLVLGLVGFVVSLLYRWITIAAFSATPGMALFGLSVRDMRGDPVGPGLAFWHSATFLVLKGFVLPQLVSIVMMLASSRGQGLHDALTGAVVINDYRRLTGPATA